MIERGARPGHLQYLSWPRLFCRVFGSSAALGISSPVALARDTVLYRASGRYGTCYTLEVRVRALSTIAEVPTETLLLWTNFDRGVWIRYSNPAALSSGVPHIRLGEVHSHPVC
jgi:hypothetical protein